MGICVISEEPCPVRVSNQCLTHEGCVVCGVSLDFVTYMHRYHWTFCGLGHVIQVQLYPPVFFYKEEPV